MTQKRKKIIMYVGISVIFLCLLLLWFFQLKINFRKKSKEEGFFSTMQGIFKETKESYNSLDVESLMNPQKKDGININKLKDKILSKYVKEKIKEQQKKGEQKRK